MSTQPTRMRHENTRQHNKTLEPDDQRNAANAAHNKQRSTTTQPDDQCNTECGTQQTTQHDNATPPTPGDATSPRHDNRLQRILHDRIPVGGKRGFVVGEVRQDGHSLDDRVFQKSLAAPVSNTEKGAGRFRGQAVADMGQKETALTEDTLHIDRAACAYYRTLIY
jgi:hypothetical protein